LYLILFDKVDGLCHTHTLHMIFQTNGVIDVNVHGGVLTLGFHAEISGSGNLSFWLKFKVN